MHAMTATQLTVDGPSRGGKARTVLAFMLPEILCPTRRDRLVLKLGEGVLQDRLSCCHHTRLPSGLAWWPLCLPVSAAPVWMV